MKKYKMLNKCNNFRGDRNLYIDVSKGIAIMLMVIGHSGMPLMVHDFIYSFHMPFFFLISGTLYKEKYSFCKYITIKVRKLLIPFLFYAIINVLLRCVLYNESVFSYIIRHSYSGCESALWFLPILFFASIINYLVKSHHILPLGILFSMALSSVITLNNINLPWSFSILPLSIAFIFIGRYYSSIICRVTEMNRKKLVSVTVISIVILLVVSHFYTLECKDNTSTEPIAILVVTAIIGSMMLIFVSILLKKFEKLSGLLVYLGQNTMLILGLSQIILKYENLVISQFALLKYIVLFTILMTLIYLKDKIKILNRINL